LIENPSKWNRGMNIVKVRLIHMGYFVALITLSFISFVVIIGAGFVGKVNIFILVFPFALSGLWLSDYT
jgi:hypothetical protein